VARQLPLDEAGSLLAAECAVLLRARIVCVGVDLHFVKENEIRGPVSTSLQFYYLQEPLPSCDALRNSLTHLQSM